LRKLKTLRANIYRYYFDLVKKQRTDDLQVVLERLLVDYKKNFFDSAYYHLKTTDSLPRYKRTILETISRIHQDEKYMDMMTNQALEKRRALEYNDAYNYVEERIYYIANSMEAMEYLIEGIDSKNELYINAAASKIMFLTNTSEDLEGLMNRLFKVILSDKKIDYSQIFNLFRARNLDENSLQTVRRPRVDAVAEPIDYDQDISEEVKERKMASLLKANIFSKKEINNFVNYQLGDAPKMLASQIELEGHDDFVKLILVFLFSKSVGMSYDVRLLNYDAKIGNIKFTDFEIFKKGRSL
ncbi:MAG TPA: hypothetical protein GX698_02245, partial [Acholeplasmataceae bacterium]|nr:hypothetical protein [Acholeplasmataceae bacterium]